MDALRVPSRSAPGDMPDREPRRPGLGQGRRAGQRPVEAAAQDPREGFGCRRPAHRQVRRTRSACRGRRKDLNILSGLALRAIRQGCARPGRGPACLRDRRGKAQDEPGSGRRDCRCIKDRFSFQPCSGPAQPLRPSPSFMAKRPVMNAKRKAPISSLDELDPTQFEKDQDRLQCCRSPLGAARGHAHDGLSLRQGDGLARSGRKDHKDPLRLGR